MEKIVNKLINHMIKGVDTYTHNGSTWLIFTESKQWVIELTDSKTLWYNYNFFKGMFAYTSMDVVENQHYITKWVEDNIVGGVKKTLNMSVKTHRSIEDTLVNGVKENSLTYVGKQIGCDDAIENGVKETNHVDVMKFFDNKMDDAIKNGVRHTLNTEYMPTSMVEDIIENGVKKTSLKRGTRPFMVNETLKNGVKETKTPGKDGDILSTIEWMEENKSTSYTKMIDDVIDNGVKKTMLRQHITDGNVETIIETGIKEVQPLPEQSGELIGYGNYYKLKEDRTKPFIDYLEETIKFGVKESLG